MLSDRTNKALEGIEKASMRGFGVKHLFKIMTNRTDLWLKAYENIYANKGAVTKGINNNTLDGMSYERFKNLIQMLKGKQYLPTPVKRIYIPKSNGKQRPLGIPIGDDKLVQEVIRVLLERVYEPVFSNMSHGFRPKRSCHTALTFMRKYWKGTTWIIDMDIKGYFDNINHDILINILESKIQDKKFIKLIRMFLKAGYLEQWKFHGTYSGTPQGGIISPILANIYLHELDKFMKKQISKFKKGKRRKANPEYTRLQNQIHRLRVKLKNLELSADEREAAQTEMERLIELRFKLPSKIMDNFRRLKYIRYADDFVIGVTGNRREALQIMDEVKQFLNEQLDLEVSEEKSGLRHSSKGTKFLGYLFRNRTTSRIIKTATVNKNGKKFYSKRRSISGSPHLSVPEEKIVGACRKFSKGNKPCHRTALMNNSDVEIILQYNSELRGIANYYALANKSCIRKIEKVALSSLFKTLAYKHKTSVKKIRAKLKKDNEHVLEYETKGKIRTLKVYKLRHRLINSTQDIDKQPLIAIYANTTELLERFNIEKCEYCGTEKGYFEVHHIRKLSDIKDGKENWQKHMIARKRKTLVLCVECHDLLHAGKLPSWRKDLYIKTESAVH